MTHQTVLVIDFWGLVHPAHIIISSDASASLVFSIPRCSLWTRASEIPERKPSAVILSGGPRSILEVGAPDLDFKLVEGIPVLGICYGQQLMADRLGGKVEKVENKEYGFRRIRGVEPGGPAGTRHARRPWRQPGQRPGGRSGLDVSHGDSGP